VRISVAVMSGDRVTNGEIATDVPRVLSTSADRSQVIERWCGYGGLRGAIGWV